jgi:hypothetical protein
MVKIDLSIRHVQSHHSNVISSFAQKSCHLGYLHVIS